MIFPFCVLREEFSSKFFSKSEKLTGSGGRLRSPESKTPCMHNINSKFSQKSVFPDSPILLANPPVFLRKCILENIYLCSNKPAGITIIMFSYKYDYFMCYLCEGVGDGKESGYYSLHTMLISLQIRLKHIC